MSAGKLGSTVVAALVLLTSMTSSADVVEGAKNPWRGSSVSYSHAVTAISLYKGAEPTWNPVYVHSLALRPMWHFGDLLTTSLDFQLEQELTNADDTTLRREWVWSDIGISVAPQRPWVEQESGIRVSPSLRLQLPVSRASTAQTLIFAVAPGVQVARTFPVLSGLTVSYQGRFTLSAHSKTSPGYDAPTIANCGDLESIDCARLINTGVANAWGSLSHGPGLVLAIRPRLTVSASYAFLRASLYDWDPAKVTTLTGEVEVKPLGDAPRVRWAQMFQLAASYGLTDYLDISLAATTRHADLAPDSTYRTPFFNRFTVLSLGVAVDADTLVQAL